MRITTCDSVLLYLSAKYTGPDRYVIKTLLKSLLPPATKLMQGYVFTGVCDPFHKGVVCLSACWDTTPPAPHTSPGAGSPRSRHPPGSSACWEIWATSRQYASFWNAILLKIISSFVELLLLKYIFLNGKTETRNFNIRLTVLTSRI